MLGLNTVRRRYSETPLGRKRFYKTSDSFSAQKSLERKGRNMPIQGTAADMIKIAMINIQNELDKKKYKTRMVLQVHDELLFDVHKSEVEVITKMVKEKMETAIPMSVPIVVDTGTGDNWLDAH